MTNLTIFSKEIRTLDGLYSLNDLHKASGGEAKHLPNRFVRLGTTQELITEIDQTPDLALAITTKRGGNNSGTWVCKELVYSYAMWISAKFHLQVIRAFDAMMNTPTALIDNSEQAYRDEHLRIMIHYVDLLSKKESQTLARIDELQKRFFKFQQAMLATYEELEAVRKQHSVDLDIMKHIRTHRFLSTGISQRDGMR
jgi:hypothetical protein